MSIYPNDPNAGYDKQLSDTDVIEGECTVVADAPAKGEPQKDEIAKQSQTINKLRQKLESRK